MSFKRGRGKYKNRYSLYEFLRLGVYYFTTKIFYPRAKMVCYPLYMRGKKSLVYGDGLNIGYGCRFDLLNTEKKTLFIGENCEFGDYCHVVALEKVTIGNNFLCASKVFISDNSHGRYDESENCSSPFTPPNEREIVTNPVVIGDNVWVGDNVVIMGGAKVGNGCIIGANSVVKSEIPDNCMVVGAPARIVKRYNESLKCWERI